MRNSFEFVNFLWFFI